MLHIRLFESCRCRTQIIANIASCLSFPDIFGAKSLNSISDLCTVLSEDTSPQIITLLKEVMEELESQENLSSVSLFFSIKSFFDLSLDCITNC